ncbi:MAG TPA: zinc dependent phospholipase C family protein [Longimicrobiales bacterium]|nr:zinc dependent phospholipase C family protein [Longimicrobiales bacterium]
MPLPSVHYALARGVMERWALRPAQAPFDPAAPAARNAFYHGSLGPDMGLFPGGVTELSLLAHRERTGDLTRVLVASARTPVERAFAWGWLTHVLADVAIHPTLNGYALRLLLETGQDPDDAEAMAAAHSRFELGLDIYMTVRDPAAAAVRLRPCFRPADTRFLVDAYRAVYRRDFPGDAFARSHRATTAMANALMRLERLHALAAPAPRPRPLRPVLLGIRRGLAPRLSRLNAAFLRPLAPPPGLLRVLRETARDFCDLVHRHQATRLAALGNPDLEGMEELRRLTA